MFFRFHTQVKKRRAHRVLFVEPIEPRRMLSIVTVNTDQDIVDPRDQLTSLREAIEMANDLEGADEIVFDFGHDGPATIQLEHGSFELKDEVTITGPGREMLTIDARQRRTNRHTFEPLSVIFRFVATEGDFTVEGMTLNGGGVSSASKGMLTILDSVVTNNLFEWGRGSVISAYEGDVTIRSSTINPLKYDLGEHGRRSERWPRWQRNDPIQYDCGQSRFRRWRKTRRCSRRLRELDRRKLHCGPQLGRGLGELSL